MVGQCLRLALFFQKFVIFGGKSARWGVKKWSDWNFFPLFLTFYRFTKTAQWYFVKGVDLKVPHTNMYYIVRILYKKLYASCAKNLNKTVPIRMFVLEDILMRKYLN